MPKKKYVVELTAKERARLKKVINSKKMEAHKRRKARILLKIDQGPKGPGWTDRQAAVAFDCHRETVGTLRRRLVQKGLEDILEHRNTGSTRFRALNGTAEINAIKLVCSKTPLGSDRWTVRLLAEKLVELQLVDSCSKSSVHRALQKMKLNLD